MTDQQVLEALSRLVAATPGWSDDSVEAYVEQLRDLSDVDALRSACQSIARAWVETKRPPIAVVLEAYDREQRIDHRAIDPARIHCGGDGWRILHGVGDTVVIEPCARCSPALAAVWADRDKFARWKDGVELERLDVGVERVGGRLRYTNGLTPPHCEAAPDEPVHPTLGREVAWKAYAAELTSQGRTPDRDQFDRRSAALIGGWS